MKCRRESVFLVDVRDKELALDQLRLRAEVRACGADNLWIGRDTLERIRLEMRVDIDSWSLVAPEVRRLLQQLRPNARSHEVSVPLERVDGGRHIDCARQSRWLVADLVARWRFPSDVCERHPPPWSEM